MGFDTLAILIGLFTLAYFYLKWSYSYWTRRGIPQLKPTPIFGNVSTTWNRQVSFGESLKKMYQDIRSKGHKICGIYIFASPRLIVTDLDLVKSIISTDFNHFTDRGLYVNERDDPLSAHLFNLSGQKWRNLRQKLTPTFTSAKMKMMFQTLLDCSEELIVLMDKLTDANEPVDIKEVFGRFTTDIIGSCAFGLKCNCLKHPDAEFRTFGKRIFVQKTFMAIKRTLMVNTPWLAKLLRLSMIEKDLENFFMGVVKNTLEYREKNNVTRKDFMQLLLEMKNKNANGDGTGLSLNEIAAQSFVFFNAGFETSSTVTSFVLYELATHQEIQRKVREEINQVLEKHNGKFTYEAISEMYYMKQVINEALRLYPPAHILQRRCREDYKLPGTDWTIEKGQKVFISTYGIQTDPEYFPEPEKFDPDRFSEENVRARHNFAYLPFGEGPRVCIGLRFAQMQIKVGLAVLLKNYIFTLDPKMETPIKFDPQSIVLTMKGGMWLTSKRIQ